MLRLFLYLIQIKPQVFRLSNRLHPFGDCNTQCLCDICIIIGNQPICQIFNGHFRRLLPVHQNIISHFGSLCAQIIVADRQCCQCANLAHCFRTCNSGHACRNCDILYDFHIVCKCVIGRDIHCVAVCNCLCHNRLNFVRICCGVDCIRNLLFIQIFLCQICLIGRVWLCGAVNHCNLCVFLHWILPRLLSHNL